MDVQIGKPSHEAIESASAVAGPPDGADCTTRGHVLRSRPLAAAQCQFRVQ